MGSFHLMAHCVPLGVLDVWEFVLSVCIVV